MPVSVEDLAKIGAGKSEGQKPSKSNTPKQKQEILQPSSVSDLATLGLGNQIKKKSGTEDAGSLLKEPIQNTSLAPSPSASQLPLKEEAPTYKLPTAQEVLQEKGDKIKQRINSLPNAIHDYNAATGSNENPNEILTDADRTSAFVQTLSETSNKQRNKATFEAQKLEQQAILSNAERPNIGKLNEQLGAAQNMTANPDLLPNKTAYKYINQLKEHIVDLGIDEAKVKQWDDKKLINKTYERLNPKEYAAEQKAIADRNEIGVGSFISGGIFTKDNAGDYELLNTKKAPIEFSINEARKKKSDELMTIGTLENNQGYIDESKRTQAQVKSDDEIYAKYPSLNKSRIANNISKELASRAGQLQGTAAADFEDVLNKFGFSPADISSTNEFKKAMANPSQRDAALAVLQDPSLMPDYTFAGGVAENVAKPVKDLFHSLQSITGIRDKLDRTDSEIKDGLFPDEAQNLKDYVHGVRTVANTTAMLTGYAAMGELAGVVGKGAGLIEGGLAAKTLHSGVSFGIGSYDANKTAIDKTDLPEAAKIAYATIGMGINTIGGELLELPILSKIPGLQKPMLEMATKIGDGTITSQGLKELLGKAEKPYVDAVMKYGLNVAKNTATMKFFTFGNGLNEWVFGQKNMDEVLKETTSGLVDTALGVSILSGFGAIQDIQKGKSSTVKSTLYTLANNNDAARDVIDEQYRKGNYNVPEYNSKIQILNTAVAAKNNIEALQQDRGIILETPQKKVYIANLTAEGVLNKKLESPLLQESEKLKYEEQISKLKKQREDILGGLKFDDNLSPQIAVFEAEKSYKKAQEDFNSGVVDSDKDMLAARDKYIEAKNISEGKLPETIESKKEDIERRRKVELESNSKLSKLNKGLGGEEELAKEINKKYDKELSDLEPKVKPTAAGKKAEDLTTNDLMPTIKIGDNEYSGKNHGEAMDAAIAAGEDIPDKDTPEGKEWRKENGMFKDSNGELLTREKAKEEYGIGNSEDLSDNKVVKEVAANNEINDTQIIPTFNQIKLKIPESDLAATEDIVNKVNNAESININDLNKGQDGLYAALEAHPEAAHLIEPLITKIQNYEFTTKTEISTVTERKPIEGSFKNKSKSEIKPALEKSIGGKVTITNADGTKVEGVLNLENGNYVVVNENGDKVSSIGEKAINDRDLKLPTEEEMPEPIQFDKDGRVKSVTFKTKDGKFISIDNPERALDIAIQLQADAIGIIPDAAFEQAYTEVQTEISKEVPLNDEKNKNTKDTKPTTEKIEPIKGTDKVVEQTGEGKKEQPILITNKTESNDKSKEGSKKADAEKSTEKNDAEKTNVADTGVVDEEAAPLSDVSENNVDENDPLEVSLQRDRLMKDVADAFYKPSDGSRSIADRAVLEGAVKTISREATNAGKSISEHLQSKVDNWYKSLFDATGKRLLDKNGREKQILLSDEQQAMIAIHKLNLERKIRESKTNPASIFDAADLSKMEQQVQESDYVAGVVGESVGRALRYLGNIYKSDNNSEFEIQRRQGAQKLGYDVPLDKDEFDKFAAGLTQKQRRYAEDVRNTLLKYKEGVDAANASWDKSAAVQAKDYAEEVQKQVKLVVDKAISDAKKDWEAESKKASKENKNTDSKGRVVKDKAASIAKKLNDFADKLGGKGTAMSSPLGLVQITAKWVLKAIAEGIKQGGKIPELIERYTKEAKERKEFDGHDEAKVLEQIQEALTDAGIEKKTIEAKPQSDAAIKAIKEFAKNSNTNGFTKETASSDAIKELFHSLGEQGISINKIAEKAVELLTKEGIVTDVEDINEAYLKRGKYQLDTKKELEKGAARNVREIAEHEKLQFDINEIEKKIKEVKETGTLSLKQKDEKTKQLEEQKKKKLDEFEQTLISKGIKLEKGSKYSREQKTAVIDAHNAASEALGKSIADKLNDASEPFGKLSEATKNFLREIAKKLTQKVDATDLSIQIEKAKSKASQTLIDFEKNHFTVDKRGNKALESIQKELFKISRDIDTNRDRAAEDIKLTDYKKRLDSERKEYERKKAAGIWDDTKHSVDFKKDSEAYDKQRAKDVAKYDYYRAVNAAKDANDNPFIKAIKGARELTRNLLLSGITGIQGKLALSAITRQAQFISRPIGRLFGAITGIKSVRIGETVTSVPELKNALSKEYRALKETVLTKTENQAQEILKQSGEKLDATLKIKNDAEESYRRLVKDKGEESTEATQYKLNQLSEATVNYDKAALEHTINDIYNHITPLNKGGRYIILKEGITREEQEAGLLGKKETLRDYLKTDFEKINDEEGYNEYKKGWSALSKPAKKALKSAMFFSRWIVRSHGVWKDIPARHELVKGFINRLEAAQERGEDITDHKVKTKLWFDTVLNDMQEAKFQDKNKAVELTRKAQNGATSWIKNERAKEITDIAVGTMFPVLKVPMNIFATALQYNFGAFIGTARLIDAAFKAHEIDMPLKEYAKTKMTDEQKYRIQTAIGRGTVGLAFFVSAYYATQNGSMVMGGTYPDKKRKAIINGVETELEYGDISINGHLIPHLLAKALEHLPNLYPAMMGSDYASQKIMQEGKGNPHAFIDAILATTENMIVEAPVISSLVEKTPNKYNEIELSLKNPYSYMGYIGAVKDIEALTGVEKKAPEYLLTTPEKYYNRAGLMWLVPNKKDAKQRAEKEKQDAHGKAQKIKEEFPEFFKR